MEKRTSNIQLVITIALKKEIPKEWFESSGIAVHTLAALKSGATGGNASFKSGVLIVITGAGLKASEEAACWIRDNIKPLFVLNLGTCGITDKRRSTGKWYIPQSVSNENRERLELDSSLPVPFPDDVINIQSLISVVKAQSGDSWKDHNAIDMECFSQARVFRDTNISFHCLKFGTDHSDSNTQSDFDRNLSLFREEIIKLLDFLHTSSKEIKITTILPAYNREHTIKRALDSVLSQSC
ncbi:MAG: glycosyltransferase family 2 protein [Nitrospirae bacterium]|nr:glycosyltransferase family 2 protein [Nitrospirota bacterium]